MPEHEKECEFLAKIREMTKCKKDCHRAGHYRCWKDNCPCICHAAQRVLEALGLSY